MSLSSTACGNLLIEGCKFDKYIGQIQKLTLDEDKVQYSELLLEYMYMGKLATGMLPLHFLNTPRNCEMNSLEFSILRFDRCSSH